MCLLFHLIKFFLQLNADEHGKKGTLTVRTRLNNPLHETNGKIMAKLFDPSGNFIEEKLIQVNGKDEIELPSFTINRPNYGLHQLLCFIRL
jgi:hypothetical protein